MQQLFLTYTAKLNRKENIKSPSRKFLSKRKFQSSTKTWRKWKKKDSGDKNRTTWEAVKYNQLKDNTDLQVIKQVSLQRHKTLPGLKYQRTYNFN